MIWQTARVDSGDRGKLMLTFSAPSACARCDRGDGCGAGVFSGLLQRRRTRVEVAATLDVTGGEWVRVGLAPRVVAVAACVHYGLPLIGFLALATAVHGLTPDSAWRDAAVLAGGLAGFVLVHRAIGCWLPLAAEPVVERLSCTETDSKSTNSQPQRNASSC